MVCRISVDDGMQFDSDSVNVVETRKEANYDGLRVKFIGTLGKARCSMQLDVGYVTQDPGRRRRTIRRYLVTSQARVCVCIRVRQWWPRNWRLSQSLAWSTAG